MRIIVCGSRSAWSDPTAKRELEFELDELHFEEGIELIRHGKCPRSPDMWAGDWTDVNEVDEEMCPADWTLGKGAGFFRNIEMAEKGADLCIAVWDGKSRGTLNMIQEATKVGIPVKIIPCQSKPKSS